MAEFHDFDFDKKFIEGKNIFSSGLDEVKKICTDVRLPVDVGGVRQKISSWWYCCKDVLDLRVPKDRRADFQKALEARLAGRFPCTVNVTTITRNGRR